MRAPFAYPLLRGVDAESGGAADLQTDIMRFMAILALCLMAVFALVQSLPPVPAAPADPEPQTAAAPAAEAAAVDPTPPAATEPVPVKAAPQEPVVAKEEPVVLTRPRPQAMTAAPEPPPAAPTAASAAPVAPPPERGFTLRFESDLALSRLVAQGDVGFFALDESGARRMSVQNSRLSFWAAPTPRRYHEMDRATVPEAVRDALRRTGRAARDTSWAVTLPPRLTQELERLMREHDDGALVIRRDGSLERQPS